MRRGSRRLVGAGMIAALGYAGWRAWRARVPARSAGDVTWESAPFPFPPVPRPSPSKVAAAEPVHITAFAEPEPDGSCPSTHPVKAKLASGIYHVPGSGNYDRTAPDRCYVNAEAARADGLRASKR